MSCRAQRAGRIVENIICGEIDKAKEGGIDRDSVREGERERERWR